MDSKVCKHFQLGFCKFGDKCRKPHNSKTCESIVCVDQSCEKRHPRYCKYFATFNTCKFGARCAYKHAPPKDQVDMQKLSQDINQMSKNITEMAERIKDLESELQTVRSCKDEFTCDTCGYKASSETVLKSHTTRKHKLEVLREEIPENSVIMPLLQQSRDEPTLSENIFKCDQCDSKFNTKLDIECHKVNKHPLISVPDEVYPESFKEGHLYKFTDELFKCTHCEDHFQIPDLVKHFEEVHKTFRNCWHCNHRLPSSEILLNLHLANPCYHNESQCFETPLLCQEPVWGPEYSKWW